MAARRAARGSAPGPAVDEFTVPAEKSRLLEGSRGRIEGLFEVRLSVLGGQGDWQPAAPPPAAAARIWVQLAGSGKAVRSAKVRGAGGGGTGAAPGPVVGASVTRAATGAALACGKALLARGRCAQVGGRRAGGKVCALRGNRSGPALADGCVPGGRESPVAFAFSSTEKSKVHRHCGSAVVPNIPAAACGCARGLNTCETGQVWFQRATEM